MTQAIENQDRSDAVLFSGIFERAKAGRLSAGFQNWAQRNEYGDTVAHVAGWYRNLPDDFPEELFRLTDASGYTVAEVIFESGASPALFARADKWLFGD
jgi:hypothetical protein